VTVRALVDPTGVLKALTTVGGYGLTVTPEAHLAGLQVVTSSTIISWRAAAGGRVRRMKCGWPWSSSSSACCRVSSFLVLDLALDHADFPRLLAEGAYRVDGREDGEHCQDRGGYGGDLDGEVTRPGGRLRALRSCYLACVAAAPSRTTWTVAPGARSLIAVRAHADPCQLGPARRSNRR
jgi:hypothetical protein